MDLDEEKFWTLVEDTWRSAAPEVADKRPGVVEDPSDDLDAVESALSSRVLPALREAFEKLSRDELIAMDRVLERKLYDIDRQEIQEHTDGSDDGFLYARGWIVAVGKAYYSAVNADPSKAIMDMEEERMTYLPAEVFRKKFGEEIPPSGISRETGSNKAGWG